MNVAFVIYDDTAYVLHYFVLNLVVAVLRDSVCVIAALRGRLVCCIYRM